MSIELVNNFYKNMLGKKLLHLVMEINIDLDLIVILTFTATIIKYPDNFQFFTIPKDLIHEGYANVL